MPGQVKRLSADRLRRVCDPATLPFETTTELEPTTAIIGQPRATRALAFGMGLKRKGYNIFAMGSPGTGRSMAIRRFLQQTCRTEPTPNDWLYVYNFDTPHRPRPISLPPGRGNAFRESMTGLIESAQIALTKALESNSYREAVNTLEHRVAEEREQMLDALELKAKDQGFRLIDTPSGLSVAVNDEDEAAEDNEPQAHRVVHRTLQVELEGILRELRRQERDAREERRRLDHEVAEAALREEFNALQEMYADEPEITAYLQAAGEDLIDQFVRQVPSMEDRDLDQVIDFRRYEINVLVDNSAEEGAPVLVQLNPTYENLFGRLEYDFQGNAVTTHFTQIKPGDLHRANGGYLVMYAADFMRQRETWDALKRALKAEEIEMRPPQADGPVMANSLWPLAVPLRLKIILLGGRDAHFRLIQHEEDSSDMFKVRADFSDTMPRDVEHELQYAEFVAARCREENLRPFRRDAVARIIEEGSRLAEHQGKLSTRFGAVADIVREADYWAGQRGHDAVTADDVQQALNERDHRSSLMKDEWREDVLEGSITITTDGGVVGQVNGLSIFEFGEVSFGHPSCISARTYMGDAGVTHIERETEMTGPSHDKGLFTLNAYLGGMYAQHQPLSLSASLTFEQMHTWVDGDSASAAELYALLSSLSEVPIRQGLAVTGAVNQKGEVQPIGGVNEKIEGFFDICRDRGLTGDQGVLIPEKNVVNLMLRQDVVDAVVEGRFHIWPVSSVNEGIELLTGVPAGEPNAAGDFPEGTIHYLAKKRLLELAQELKAFGEEGQRPGDETTDQTS